MKNFFLVLLGMIILSSCSEYLDSSDQTYQDPPESSLAITIDEARSDLESLLLSLDTHPTRYGLSGGRRIKNVYSIPVKKNSTRSIDTTSNDIVHIFNFEDNNGYAIMSGDRRIPSLIAITEKGNLNINDTIYNSGFAIFLDGLVNLYSEVPDDKETGEEHPEDNTDPANPQKPTTYYTYGEWKNIIYYPDGLCRVNWSQRSPYNKYCPSKNGKSTKTGCTATALAQLMYANKFPSSYNGYTFSWDSMIIDEDDQTRKSDDVARLMQQLGLPKNLDIDYGNDESNADPDNISRTIKAFGYSSVGKLETYDTSTIVNDLKNGFCVILGGYSHKKTISILGITSTSYSGGHCWLGHGLLERRREVRLMSAHIGLLSTSYESEWYILCNYGWNGEDNGYYLSKVFDANNGYVYPSNTRATEDLGNGTKYNYQYKLRAITNIRK